MPEASIRLLELALPERVFEPPSRQMLTNRLARPLFLSRMRKEEGTPDCPLLLPKSEQLGMHVLMHRHCPGAADLVMLGPPPDHPFCKVHVIPAQI